MNDYIKVLESFKAGESVSIFPKRKSDPPPIELTADVHISSVVKLRDAQFFDRNWFEDGSANLSFNIDTNRTSGIESLRLRSSLGTIWSRFACWL